MKKHSIILLLITSCWIYFPRVQAQNHQVYRESSGYSQEPLILQSPDNEYKLEGFDCARSGGFYPSSSSVSIKLYEIATNKHLCTLRIRKCNTVKQMAFSPDGKYLFLLLTASGGGGEFFMIDLDDLKRGQKRLCGRRWSTFSYNERFSLQISQEKIQATFYLSPGGYNMLDMVQSKQKFHQTVDLTEFKKGLFYNVQNPHNSFRLFPNSDSSE